MSGLCGLLGQHRAGYALAQGFYASESVFEADCEAVIMQEWHFAGMTSELPKSGDYLTGRLSYTRTRELLLDGLKCAGCNPQGFGRNSV